MSFDRGITLTTGRLLLRPFNEGDVDDLVAAARDPEMLRWMWWAPDQTPAQAREYCTRSAHDDPLHKICFAIVADDDPDKRCSGSIALQRADWVTGRVEIGYWISPWARGHGYSAEAARALVSYGLGKGLHRVELLAAAENVASQRVAERAGFSKEGRLRQGGLLPGGGRSDMILYGLVKGDLP